MALHNKRRFAREIVLKSLYQWEMLSGSEDSILNDVFNRDELPSEIREFATGVFKGTVTNCIEIDAKISQYVENWSMDRIAIIDINILRFAVYELLYHPETPARVIINEAVEIAKRYGDTKSYQFVNGILDRASKDLRKES